MPITTPDFAIDNYNGDKDHFEHVLDHLFIPAIKEAGLNPIVPKSTGSVIIQADIINNIETTDLVLCDMSCLNPNVFFELGIRTAVNKPVSLVVDEITENIPFDISTINHHKYNPSSDVWVNKKEIKKLTEHIKECYEQNSADNELWKHFSISLAAHSLKGDGPQKDDKLDYLIRQMDAMRKQISQGSENKDTIEAERLYKVESQMILAIDQAAHQMSLELGTISIDGKLFNIDVVDMPKQAEIDRIFRIISRYGYGLQFNKLQHKK